VIVRNKVIYLEELYLCTSINNATYLTNQFHQYQQSEQSPPMNSPNTKKTTTYDVGNPGINLRQAHNCGWANPVRKSQSSTLDNWIYNDHIYKQMIWIKELQYSLSVFNGRPLFNLWPHAVYPDTTSLTSCDFVLLLMKKIQNVILCISAISAFEIITVYYLVATC
jgi:hypothetical protein